MALKPGLGSVPPLWPAVSTALGKWLNFTQLQILHILKWDGSTCLGGLKEALNTIPVTSTTSGAPRKTATRSTQVKLKASVLLLSRLTWRSGVWLYTQMGSLRCPPWILSPLLVPNGVQESLKCLKKGQSGPLEACQIQDQIVCVSTNWGRPQELWLNSFSWTHIREGFLSFFLFPLGERTGGEEKSPVCSDHCPLAAFKWGAICNILLWCCWHCMILV